MILTSSSVALTFCPICIVRDAGPAILIVPLPDCLIFFLICLSCSMVLPEVEEIVLF